MQDGSSRLDGELRVLMRPLRGFAMALTQDIGEADDLVRRTLTTALERVGELGPGTDLRVWLLAITRQLFHAGPRPHHEQREPEPAAADAFAGHEWPLPVTAVRQALQQLPDDQQEALMLVGGAGLTYLETAQICGCAVGTVKSRVSRGRTRLRHLLERDSQTALPNLEQRHY